jgi:maltose O-acetyltransferase
MLKINFTELENRIFKLLTDNADILPDRWKRWLAMYYPNAKIRKLFWQKTFVEIGEGTFPNFGMIVSDDYSKGECLLYIGARVSIAPKVVFAPLSMPNNSEIMRKHPYVAEHLMKREKIVIEDDVWIGANVTILPGVRVGRHAIIGAGSVVIENVSPFTIIAGVPAKVIRTLEKH